MRHFFLEEIEAEKGKVSITGQEARHIFKVLRMKKGERFVLIDARGRRFQTVIETSGPKEIIAEIESALPSPPRSPVTVTICQALLKSGNMDLIVQKTSELGVDRICPFISARTVVTLDNKKISERMEHWKKIARSSTEQSGRIVPVQIDTMHTFASLLAGLGPDDACKVILWEGEASLDLKTVLRSSEPLNNFIGIVGPEGGFEKEEIEEAKKAGFIPVTLGQRTLRSETASLALSAIVQYESGDLNLI